MRTLALLMALLLAVGWAIGAGPALAVNPDEQLADPALEARARELSRELRCVVCQNQTIDDSDAAIAKDLRILVRERLTAGDTDAQVMAYLTDRYGDFVRLRPPLNAATVALWSLPVLVLFLAMAAAIVYLRRRPSAQPAEAALTPDEEAALEAVLAERRKREP
ncbi:cytochrome c-type biogenesis protein [Acuticoccus sp. I52.16.1]|uniref:cytochrome c-type biogenesis protein n=1 Tax=Acuticoccus sp. I52.16.1 TaxID=2928472 RepID=UPI001FD33EDF|nr:cytochrome c-type biogenesis protein [Acuticoccus sp. I52.16.1]UOM34250.1 cytochrome c-type biogenesis protein CcmH [Acuticoccus sp. I52.16.1]